MGRADDLPSAPVRWGVSRSDRGDDLCAAAGLLAQEHARAMPADARRTLVSERLVAVAAAAHARKTEQFGARRRQCTFPRRRRARRDTRKTSVAGVDDLAGCACCAQTRLQEARQSRRRKKAEFNLEEGG